MLALLLFCIFFNTNAITTFHDRHSSETIALAMDTYNERLVRKKKPIHISENIFAIYLELY